jgi:hypothetical protein
MNYRDLLIGFALGATIAGCATQSQMLQTKQPSAMDAALARGRFDLNCPQATGTVLSSDFVQPAMQGPWVSGLERLEFTVGVEGCGQREVYVVLCQQGTTTCFAAHPNDRFAGH